MQQLSLYKRREPALTALGGGGGGGGKKGESEFSQNLQSCQELLEPVGKLLLMLSENNPWAGKLGDGIDFTRSFSEVQKSVNF